MPRACANCAPKIHVRVEAMKRRVVALENKLKAMDKKLKRLEKRLIRVKPRRPCGNCHPHPRPPHPRR